MNTKFKFHATFGVIHPIIEAANDILIKSEKDKICNMINSIDKQESIEGI